MDIEMNMDEIDFWELIEKNNSEHEMAKAVTLRMSPRQEEQPPSNISTLPSEDEMDVEYFINAPINMSQQEEMTSTRIYQVENIDAAENFGYEKHAPLEMFATSETSHGALINNREMCTPEQLPRNESKKEKNRQSAKRSREKKKVELEELQKKNTALEEKHKALVLQVGALGLDAKLLELQVKKLSCCIQEIGDDPYEETGISSKVSWTKEDEEFVEFLDKIPGLTIKTPMIQQEANESPPTAFQEDTKYTYKLEGYVPNLYDDMGFECMEGEYNVKVSTVNDESDGQFVIPPEFFQGSDSLSI